MNVLDLFSGIGGFSLGLERAGMRTAAFCEIDPFCRAVLRKHWPEVPTYDDIKTLTASRLVADGVSVDVICGGFPCQDISTAGKGAGLAGARSGLWKEYARLVGELRPRFVIVENVAALLSRGIDEVLGDLAALGYDAEWHCIPASHVGAPHRRDRVWIVAYPDGERQQRVFVGGGAERSGTITSQGPMDAVDASGSRSCARLSDVAYPGRESAQVPTERQLAAVKIPQRNSWWETEPDVGRVAHGVPARLDRLKALGNAVVPQIPEIIGKWIMNYESTRHDE